MTDSQYDALNRTTLLEGTSGASLPLYGYTYGYDAAGNVRRVSETYSNTSLNRVVTNEYDAINRLTQETVTGSGAGTTAFTYDDAHNRETMSKGGTTSSYSYNTSNQLTGFSEGLRTVSYSYDDNGNRASRTEGPKTDRYQWDMENRLVGFNGPEVPPRNSEGGPWVDNELPVREEMIGEPPTTGAVLGRGKIYRPYNGPYEGPPRVYPEISPDVAYQADYYWVSNDGEEIRGLVVVDGALMEKRAYRPPSQQAGWIDYRFFVGDGRADNWYFIRLPFDPYDESEELYAEIVYRSSEGATLFTYDYRTRRVELAVDNVITQAVFSGGTSVREFEDGVASVDYVRGSDWGGGVGGILYTTRAGVPSFTHYNRRGDVTAKTNGTGVVTYQATYEAFGLRATEVGATADRQKSNTKDEDIPGYANEGFRFRDLETGAFISKDPAGFVDGPNLYTYVRQNPWTKFDPKGLLETTVTDAQAANLPDSSEWVNGYVNKVVQRAYSLGQKGLEVRGYKDVADFVHQSLTKPSGDIFGNNTKLVRDLKFENPQSVERGDLRGSRYDNGMLRARMGGDEILFKDIPLADGINLGGQAVGTDKLDHMFHDGYALMGQTETSARKISELGEQSLLGLDGSGVYSHADIEANMNGRDFYNELKDNFENEKPFKFDINKYDPQKMNENKNKNEYTDSVRKKVESNEKKQEEELEEGR